MTAFRQTPSQTVGPFFAYGLVPAQYGYPAPSLAGPDLAGEAVAGERIRIIGQVLDGERQPVNDALIEVFQADAAGRLPDGRRNDGFTGFGRCGTGTDAAHRFAFTTVKPGVAAPPAAPHIAVTVFMRGLLSHVFTRLYFSDDATLHAADPVLASLPADRRGTLIAARQNTPAGPVYRFDIHMQGSRETVFFDL